MHLFQVLSIVMVISAICSYINYSYVKLPSTIGVMVVALIASLAMLGIGIYDERLPEAAGRVLGNVNFDETVLHGMLPFLLFAGALQVDLSALGDQKGAVLLLSTVGVLISTAIVGGFTWLLMRPIAPEISLMPCLLFGALISPTDPVAVLAIVRKAGAPKALETKIAGESLFNDGIGVVVFLTLLEFRSADADVSAGHVLGLLAAEALGGIVLGLVVGFIAYLMLRRVNQYQVEILITLALAMGGYALAEALHTSAPIAIVVAGLLIGNQGRAFAMSELTRHNLDLFWELIDEILNVVLFSLIGLELLIIPSGPRYVLAAAGAIVIVLLARWSSVAGTITFLKRFRTFSPGAIQIMTWSGLRGAISVALALSLPYPNRSIEREMILAITYGVVVFSIIVQGLTISPLVRRYARSSESDTSVPGPIP